MTAQMHRRRVDKGSDPIGAHCKRGSPHSLGGASAGQQHFQDPVYWHAAGTHLMLPASMALGRRKPSAPFGAIKGRGDT